MEDINAQKTGHQYKDTLFRTLFGDSKNFLELYNAVADEHIPDDTIVTPCPSNNLLAKFNDLAARIGNQLIVFFEHQSTLSTNMPLRLLSYVTDILHLHIVDKDLLYGNTQVMIPTPKFYVLYNGEQKLPKQILQLSDAYISHDSDPALQLTAKVIDINLDSGELALTRSPSLQGYSFLIEEIRKNQLLGMSRDNAIITAIDFCINTDVLADFLTEHYLEVSKMLNWEYDADAERKVRDAESIQQGQLQGIELLAKLISEGMSLDDAKEKAKSLTVGSQPS